MAGKRWRLGDIAVFARSLPGTKVGLKWGHRTWMIGDKGYAWERPLGKADLKRLGDARPPEGDIVAVRVESLDAKDALLAIAPPGFFTIEHFKNYPALLIELRLARIADVRAAITGAWRLVAPPEMPARPARKRARPRNSRTPRPVLRRSSVRSVTPSR